MRIPLTSPVRKLLLLLAAFAAITGYLWLVSRSFLAAYFSQRTDLASLQRAVRWEPDNADYRYLLGRYLLLVQRSPESAVETYRSAVALNPYQARYWFDLATA